MKSCPQCLISVILAPYVVSDNCTWDTFCATRIIRGLIVLLFRSKVTFENISRLQNRVQTRLFKKPTVATESNAYKNKLIFKPHHPAIEMLFQKDTTKGNVKLKVLALDLICVLCIMYYFYQNLYTFILCSSWESRALSIILSSVYSTMEILALKQNKKGTHVQKKENAFQSILNGVVIRHISWVFHTPVPDLNLCSDEKYDVAWKILLDYMTWYDTCTRMFDGRFSND